MRACSSSSPWLVWTRTHLHTHTHTHTCEHRDQYTMIRRTLLVHLTMPSSPFTWYSPLGVCTIIVHIFSTLSQIGMLRRHTGSKLLIEFTCHSIPTSLFRCRTRTALCVRIERERQSSSLFVYAFAIVCACVCVGGDVRTCASTVF